MATITPFHHPLLFPLHHPIPITFVRPSLHLTVTSHGSEVGGGRGLHHWKAYGYGWWQQEAVVRSLEPWQNLQHLKAKDFLMVVNGNN